MFPDFAAPACRPFPNGLTGISEILQPWQVARRDLPDIEINTRYASV
ncbi:MULTISPECIES: hypothetical protein [Cupriavidus]